VPELFRVLPHANAVTHAGLAEIQDGESAPGFRLPVSAPPADCTSSELADREGATVARADLAQIFHWEVAAPLAVDATPVLIVPAALDFDPAETVFERYWPGGGAPIDCELSSAAWLRPPGMPRQAPALEF
jgi:hypothetical protein